MDIMILRLLIFVSPKTGSWWRRYRWLKVNITGKLQSSGHPFQRHLGAPTARPTRPGLVQDDLAALRQDAPRDGRSDRNLLAGRTWVSTKEYCASIFYPNLCELAVRFNCRRSPTRPLRSLLGTAIDLSLVTYNMPVKTEAQG
jgi:hypothetical protein